MGQTLIEALAVVLAGAALAFGANAWSDGGLELGRDYFPRSAQAAVTGLQTESTVTGAATAAGPPGEGADERASEPAPPVEVVAPSLDVPEATVEAGVDADPLIDHEEQEIIARLAAKGLSAIDHEDFVALMADPMMAAGAYLVLDARRAEDFTEGHIPGAVHFDPFYPEQYLPDLMPLLPVAQRIVVYCNGGVCDDSESAALILSSFVSSPGLIEVYVGGISAWRDAGLEVEQG